MKGRTRVNHPPDVALPPDNRPLVAPVYQSVKFAFETLEETLRFNRGEREGYFYTRRSNPTTRQLEVLLAELQQRDDCVATGSGAAAVATCLISQLRAGDHILGFVETYGPTLALIRGTLTRLGVAHTLLSVEDDAGIERVLAERKTRLVYFESPTNPLTRIADISRITRAAHAAGALTVMDNTFAGFHNHGQYGVDIFVHSLTKYASGHGDVMGGAIIARKELAQAIRREGVLLGPLLDPHAAFLVMRGMKTYYLRYEAQAASALRIAAFLAEHPAVSRVHYPGLPDHPRHALARAQMHEFGSIVAFELARGAEAVRPFMDALEFFAITPSLGSVESLAMPPQLLRVRGFNAEQQALAGIGEGTVRLSIGIEDMDELIEDLDSALGGGR
ncbi:MAG TPA: PLP-dependent aspartate aminotransferase family protein [Steroidobacteraceae bacterium]|nr:PLP-dependent aspartate aminotransferase family protein [Steroidobacteraceae bacterium]